MHVVRDVIDAVASAGSFLDGGGSRPLQRAAISLLTDEHSLAETRALHHAFSRKRSLMLEGVRSMGITVDAEPEGTFYVWGNLSKLGGGLDDGHRFFRAALTEKVIVVPGEFFDVNPGKRRHQLSRFRQHVRFSFGPSEAALVEALRRLALVVQRSA